METTKIHRSKGDGRFSLTTHEIRTFEGNELRNCRTPENQDEVEK